MAVSRFSYDTSVAEVEYFCEFWDRYEAQSIIDVLKTQYGHLNIKYGGDISDLSYPHTYRSEVKPVLFLSQKREVEHLLHYDRFASELFASTSHLRDKLIICILGNSFDNLSSLLKGDQYHLIDASKGTSANLVAFLIAKALNIDPMLTLKELVGNIKLDPDLSELVKSDKALGPIFKILQTSETNQATESGENVQKHYGMESHLLKICISQTPVWKERMKMLLVLTDQVKLTSHLEKIGMFIDTKEEPLPSTSTQQGNTSDWGCFLKNEDKLGMYYLLKQKQFPTKQQLDTACEKFGRKSQFIHKICDIIGCKIKKPDNFIVWPAYRVENENHIIFVTDCSSFQQISDLEIIYRNEEDADSENSDVIKKAVEDDIMIPDDWLTLLKRQINNHSSEVRKKHSNITIITASPFRSKGYKKGNHEMIVENCMVLLVPLKGFIPLQEDVIPRLIGGIKTDIREDSFQWHVGGKPFIEHSDLKMGCSIGSAKQNATGTLGGFVDHPEHGLCALTCAHVLLAESELLLLINNKTFVGRGCVQPSNSSSEFGKLKTCIWEDRGIDKPGIDVALIKLEARFPISGYFPDIEEKELQETGFNDSKELKYTSGKVCVDIKAHKRCHLVKYGATTTLTHGIFGFDGLDLAYKPVDYFNRLVLRNQIQVNHIHNCKAFSERGDSGSLMFILLDNELVAAGLVLGGGTSYSVVTPICEVLQAVGCRTPPLMKMFPDNEVSQGDTGVCSDDKEPMEIDMENNMENANNISSRGVPKLDQTLYQRSGRPSSGLGFNMEQGIHSS